MACKGGQQSLGRQVVVHVDHIGRRGEEPHREQPMQRLPAGHKAVHRDVLDLTSYVAHVNRLLAMA